MSESRYKPTTQAEKNKAEEIQFRHKIEFSVPQCFPLYNINLSFKKMIPHGKKK